MYNQRYAETDMGNSPDFVKLAESYGINAERVTDVGETQKVLSKALKDNEALVVDIEIEKNEFIPMFPAGEPVDFVLGEYKYESDGVIQRVTGLFTRRGFNIDSIAVGASEVEGLARMVFVVKGDQKILEQVIKQTNKLVDVVKVKDLDPNNSVKRELCLVKVKTSDDKVRSEIMQYSDVFRAQIVDVCDNNLTVEITGSPSKIDSFISLLKPFGIKRIARTGMTAVPRGRG